MIFYFTGTGNSLYAAKQIGGELISIPQVIHRKEQSWRAEEIGIVCPVYGHEMPAMVKGFLKKAEFQTEYFFFDPDLWKYTWRRCRAGTAGTETMREKGRLYKHSEDDR